LYKKVIYL